jgi:hypothetical protein
MIDRDGYRVREKSEFTSPGIYKHYINAYRRIDARLDRGTPRGRLYGPGEVARRAASIVNERSKEAWQASGSRQPSLPPPHLPNDISEVREHLAVCIRGLEEDPKRFERFKWFKRNLYKGLRYCRGRVRPEAILDFVDDWLIKILENDQVFIPRPRMMASKLVAYGEKYGC